MLTVAWWLPLLVSGILETFFGFGTLLEVIAVLPVLVVAYCVITNIIIVWVARTMLRHALLQIEAAENVGKPIPTLPGLRQLRPTVVLSFMAYVTCGPIIAYATLEWFFGHSYSLADYVFASLSALPAALIVAFVMSFIVADVFSDYLAPRLVSDQVSPLSVRFMTVGSVPPLVVALILILYYRHRTGYFEVETVMLWVGLLLFSGLGSWLGLRSLRKSLRPLQDYALGRAPPNEALLPRSLDEIGELTNTWARLLEARKKAERHLLQAQKAEVVGRLTGGIAHDFNNLLMTVQGSFELIQMDVAQGSETAEIVSDALRACDRATELTRGLVTISGRRALRPKPMRLSDALEESWKMLVTSLGEDIALQLETPREEWACDVDAAELQNALLNLVINARDAMPDGGTISITVAQRVVKDEEDLDDGEYVELRIADDGAGITSEHLPNIFEPFYTTKDVGAGSGLGLASVHGFAKQSGGCIRVESTVDVGTTFTIALPRTMKTPSGEVARVVTASTRGRDEHVLLVEDEPGVRALLLAQLSSLGFNPEEAVSGRDVLDRIDKLDRPDLIVCDVVMPGGLNGPEFVDRIRFRWADVPILFISGYSRDHLIRDGRLPSDVELLEKPFRRDDLGRAIRRILDTNSSANEA